MKQIYFIYMDYDQKRRPVARNNGEPYIVSPFRLIWNGDYYYIADETDFEENITILWESGLMRRLFKQTMEKFAASRFEEKQLLLTLIYAVSALIQSLIKRFC